MPLHPALIPVYDPLPIAFARGEGVWLWDTEGKRYLDATSGIGVCNLGHCHPSIVSAIQKQAAELMHTSNAYTIPHEVTLAQRLTRVTGMQQAFFCSSGAEANETAIKIARLYGHSRQVQLPSIIVVERAFHGRTLATLSATGNRKVQAGFEPLVQGFIRVPYNDIAAIRQVAQNSSDVVAILLEPILGEGGVIIPDPGYLAAIRALCDEYEWLMMLDEVQTGVGRTGQLLAMQYESVIPDVLLMAKGLAGGIPIGACLISGNAMNLLQVGQHGTTFGGNPLCCAAALAVLDVFEQRTDLLPHVRELGAYLLNGLKTALKDIPHIVGIRGQGLMIAIELDAPCRPLRAVFAEQGLLCNITRENTIRLLPPLVLQKAEADEIIRVMSKVLPLFKG